MKEEVKQQLEMIKSFIPALYRFNDMDFITLSVSLDHWIKGGKDYSPHKDLLEKIKSVNNLPSVKGILNEAIGYLESI